MQVIYSCPLCEKTSAAEPVETGTLVQCMHCDWQKSVSSPFTDGQPGSCVICGCEDLWRQKDFPQFVGLLFVAVGAIISSIFWYYHEPVFALGTLMGFALIDLLLYTFMKDMLVCYRCRARHRRTNPQDEISGFDLEIAERYRQQDLRMKQSG